MTINVLGDPPATTVAAELGTVAAAEPDGGVNSSANAHFISCCDGTLRRWGLLRASGLFMQDC